MDWLENIRVTVGKSTFTNVVEQVEPVLLRCSISKDGRRAADCLAHLGWADFLRSREGTGVVDPVDRYRRALALDSENVYAHSMWGFELLRTRGSMGEAKAHFDRALATRRERAYVRHLELAGFFWGHDPESEEEALRVVNDMRLGGESLPADSKCAQPGRVASLEHLLRPCAEPDRSPAVGVGADRRRPARHVSMAVPRNEDPFGKTAHRPLRRGNTSGAGRAAGGRTVDFPNPSRRVGPRGRAGHGRSSPGADGGCGSSAGEVDRPANRHPRGRYVGRFFRSQARPRRGGFTPRPAIA